MVSGAVGVVVVVESLTSFSEPPLIGSGGVPEFKEPLPWAALSILLRLVLDPPLIITLYVNGTAIILQAKRKRGIPHLTRYAPPIHPKIRRRMLTLAVEDDSVLANGDITDSTECRFWTWILSGQLIQSGFVS